MINRVIAFVVMNSFSIVCYAGKLDRKIGNVNDELVVTSVVLGVLMLSIGGIAMQTQFNGATSFITKALIGTVVVSLSHLIIMTLVGAIR